MTEQNGKAQAYYEIRIKGYLEERWQAWFNDLAFSYEGDHTTVLRGYLADQAALHGVLSHIKNLNLQLISVQLVENLEESNE